jgi:hypothetical protein
MTKIEEGSGNVEGGRGCCEDPQCVGNGGTLLHNPSAQEVADRVRPARTPFASAFERVLLREEGEKKRLRTEYDAMLANLTTTQEASTRLALENQQLRALISLIHESAAEIRARICGANYAGSATWMPPEDRNDILLAVLAITGACQSAEAARGRP